MAVSQVLAFCLLVLESQHQNPRVITQDDRWNASQNLHAWTVDWELILREIPETERKHTPNPSPWHLRTYQGVDRSPYLLRPLDGGRFSRTCRSEVSQGEQDRRPSPKSSDEEMTPDSPLQRQRRPGGHGGSGKPQPPPGRSHCSAQQPQRGKQSRPYCSQRCLQGLVCREKLDSRCPNVMLHRKRSHDDVYHGLDQKTFLDLVRKQLFQTLDVDCEPLAQQGARGAAFKGEVSLPRLHSHRQGNRSALCVGLAA